VTVGRRLLGRTGRTVSELGFGCGGLWARRWIDDQDAIDLIHRAIELGITTFDTGKGHGDGLAEERLGRALRSHRHRIDRLVFSAKVGTVPAGRWSTAKDFSPATIERQLLESLERLGVDHIPILFLDGPEPSHITDDLLDTLLELKRDGFIGLIGVNGAEYQIEAALMTDAFDVIMPVYNPTHRSSEPVIAAAAARGLGVLGTGSLSRMAFSTAPPGPWSAPRTWWYAGRRWRDRLVAGDRVRRARAYAYLDRVRGWTAAQACLGFALANEDVHCAVFATTSLEHLTENAAASGRTLSPGVLKRVYDTR